MPKMRSHSGSKKRFKITGTGRNSSSSWGKPSCSGKTQTNETTT